MAWQVLHTESGTLATGLGTRPAVDALDAEIPVGPVRGASQRFHAAARSALSGPALAAAEAAIGAMTRRSLRGRLRLTASRRVPHHRPMARPGSSMAMPRRPRSGRS